MNETTIHVLVDESPLLAIDGLDTTPNPAELASVPEHLRGYYESLDVPPDVVQSAAAGKISQAEIVAMPDGLTDRDEYKRLAAQSTSRTLGLREAVHDWRLNEAARLHESEERKQATGAYLVACEVCGARDYFSSMPVLVGCRCCQECARAVHQARQARDHDRNPTEVARRAFVARVLDQDEEQAS